MRVRVPATVSKTRKTDGISSREGEEVVLNSVFWRGMFYGFLKIGWSKSSVSRSRYLLFS